MNICSMIDLVGAITEVDSNIIRTKFNLPVRVDSKHCATCGKHIAHSKSHLCLKCYMTSKRIYVSCSCGCGKTFKRREAEIIYSTSKRGYQHFFLNRKHAGNWIGKMNKGKVRSKPNATISPANIIESPSLVLFIKETYGS